MTTASQKAKGEETKQAVLKKLTKKPQHVSAIVEKMPERLRCGHPWAAGILKQAVIDGKAEKVREGRSVLYRLPASVSEDAARG